MYERFENSGYNITCSHYRRLIECQVSAIFNQSRRYHSHYGLSLSSIHHIYIVSFYFELAHSKSIKQLEIDLISFSAGIPTSF